MNWKHKRNSRNRVHNESNIINKLEKKGEACEMFLIEKNSWNIVITANRKYMTLDEKFWNTRFKLKF